MAALIAVLSGVLWGAADFGGGLISRRLRAVVVVACSQLAACVAIWLAVVVRATVQDVDLSAAVRPGGWLVWGLAAGLCGVSGLLCFYRALATGTMGVVSPIAALGSGLVPVLAGVAWGERPSGLHWFGMAVALAGALAASGPELSPQPGSAGGNDSARRTSVLLAVLAGVLFGLTMALVARGTADGGALLTSAAMRLFSLVAFGAAALGLRTLGGVGRADLPGLAVVGIADSAANIMFGWASSLGMISVVAVLGSLYPVVTVMLARVVLRERLQPIQVAGVGLALAGVALLTLG